MQKIKVGITMGDPSGIGPSITAKALSRLSGLAEFIIFGDRWVFKKAQNLQLSATRRGGFAKNYGEKAQGCQFVDLNNINHKTFSFGKIKAEYGRASIEYLDKALEFIRHKKIDCLVTCPISKEAIHKAGFTFSGHSEYLAQKTKSQDFVMLLLNKYLKFSLLTRHIPLKDVPRLLNKSNIEKTVFLTVKSLGKLFLIRHPRLVICALNPHASDHGLIGKEEQQFLQPAIKKLKSKKINIQGPLPADTAILKAYRKEYDCIIALYHDQALIPLKLSGDHSGVNITLGLPFIRTSPLHGTAFDLAGTNLASPASLIAAIKLAIKCRLNLRKA